MRTRVKICGITNEADLQAAVSAGADAIGLIMHEKSPRYVDLDLAAALAKAVPPLVTVVGLFADSDAEAVRAALSRVPFDLLQFQGDESPGFCGSFSCRYIKALRVAPDLDLSAAVAAYAESSGILLDAWVKGAYGGTGVALDWGSLPVLPVPVVLAGGLTPDNVGQAIRTVNPWGVDVCSGVEASPGLKDSQKLEAFVAAVGAADEELS